MSSSITPPPPNKRFRNLYLSLTLKQTTTTQQDLTTKMTTTNEEVEVEGENDDDVPKTKKSIFIIEVLKKSIKDDGLLKDSPTWYYLLLTSSTAPPTTIFSDGDDDDSGSSGDDHKAPSSTSMMMIDMMSEGDIDTTSQKKQPTICCQIQILAYHKNKSSWKHTHQQLSKILLMMGMGGSSKQHPNLHRGRSDDDNISHPPNPPRGGNDISLPFQQKWECTQWEWEEVSMMAFKQRFNSLLLQRRQQARTAASQMDDEFTILEEEESNPQHRPASLVFDQYFSSHFHDGGCSRNNLFQGNSQEEAAIMDDDDLSHHQLLLQEESKKISKKGSRRLSSSSSTTTTKNHFPQRRQKSSRPTPAIKLTTDLVARVSVEEFLETNPSVDQFLKFQKCKLLIDQISKHQQQQDLYLDQADSDCPEAPSRSAENKVFQYKWPSHLDKLQFPIIWQWFSQWHQQPQSVEKLPQLRSNHDDVDSPTMSNHLIVGGGGDDGEEEQEPVCKVEPSQEEIFEGKGGEDPSPLLQSTSPKDDDKMMIEHPEEQLHDSSNKHQTRRRFKALVLYSEERGVGKTSLARSFVYNNQNWIIHCRNKFNADQFKLSSDEEEAKLLLIDDFNFDPKIHHECFKALVTSEPTGIRDAYLNLQFKHGLPTIICTNDTKFYEYLLKSPDFQHDCMFSDVSGQYLGPPHTRQSQRAPSKSICADPKTLARFQQLTRESNEAAEDQDDEEDEETMFLRAYNGNNNNRVPTTTKSRRRNYQQLLLREAEAFLQTGNPRHRNRGSIYEDDPQLQYRRRKTKNNMFL